MFSKNHYSIPNCDVFIFTEMLDCERINYNLKSRWSVESFSRKTEKMLF